MRHVFPVAHMGRVVLFSLALTACDPPAPRDGVPILLFSGNGTSPGDVAAVERILDHNHLEYATATSRQLNRISASQLMAYRLVIVPGGDFISMAANMYVQLSPGLYTFAVRSDDGFMLTAGTDFATTNATLGVFNAGRFRPGRPLLC